MTPSLGQALSGLVSASAHAKSPAATAKSKDDSFGDMVKGSEKQPGRGTQRQAGLPAAQPSKQASTDPATTEAVDVAPDAAGASNIATGKAAKKCADTDDFDASIDGDANGQDASTPSLQDRLPLLMALHDIKQFSTSAGTASAAVDRSTLDGSIPAGSPLAGSMDGQLRASDPRSAKGKVPPVPAERAEAMDAIARSSRATAATAFSGAEHGQPFTAVTKLDESPSVSDQIRPPQQDQEPTDLSGPASKRPISGAKETQPIQLSASSAPTKQASSTGRLDVVSQQSFPAPAQNPLSQTASALVEAIASDKAVQQAYSSAAAGSQTTASVAVPTHVLKIELHPAELGMVTASLRLSGEQLSIEMKPETHEAYRRLATDSDAIVKSMRSLGFDVDKVTILQPSIAVHSTGRTDANSALPMSTGRDQPSFQPGNSGGNGSGGERQPGRSDGNGAQEFGRAASPLRDSAGDDIYI